MDLPIKIELPDGFLNEEIRCDYTVSSQMKEVWAVELDLVKEFQRVCQKNNLRYYADGGTLLGTIRHQGFIPWDDDIDITMFRGDYEKLCEIAPKEFQFPYFFQNEYTDPGSFKRAARLRNSLTTGITKKERQRIRKKFNQGIFIDIFPLDAVPDDPVLFKKQLRNIKMNFIMAGTMAFFGAGYIPSDIPFVDRMRQKGYKLDSGFLNNKMYYKQYIKYFRKFEEECNKYNDDNTYKVSKLISIPLKSKRIWYREDFSSVQPGQFEFLEIPMPVGYQRILTTFYGSDWRTPKIAASTHVECTFDTHKPYTQYLEEHK